MSIGHNFDNPAENFKKLKKEVVNLNQFVSELASEMIVRRLPARRIRNLQHSWIIAFLQGEGSFKPGNADVSVERLKDGSAQTSVYIRPPMGAVSTPDYFILRDEEDEEMLLANRIECVLYIAHGTGSSPVQTLLRIESCANAMERIAVETLD